MRRLTDIAVVLGFVASVTVLVGVDSAAADDKVCKKKNPQTGVCLVWIDPEPSPPPDPDPSNPPTGNTGDSRHVCYWDPEPQGLSGPPAGPVPCTSDAGYWSNTYHCYIRRMDPQPPANARAWQGHEPGDGAVYDCYQPQTGIAMPIWAPNPPPGATSGPTPLQVAQGALARLQLKAINIGITPDPVEEDPDSIGIVGLPIYLWVEEPNPTTFGPASTRASAGGITVTLTAKVERIEWTMGDGTTVTCSGSDAKGTPYQARFGTDPSSTCGHVYEQTSWDQPNHVYQVTARSYWRIDWSGAGQSGTIRLDPLEQTVHLRIGEAQVLTQ